VSPRRHLVQHTRIPHIVNLGMVQLEVDGEKACVEGKDAEKNNKDQRRHESHDCSSLRQSKCPGGHDLC